MPRQTQVPLPVVARLLAEVGDNLRLARKRRKLSAALLAERAGMSRPTLRALERGDSGVTLGSLANVLHSLGLEDDLKLLGRSDPLGRELQDTALVQQPRVARPRKRGSSDG
jgi:transcriptional regulator with XRE-family HTH domain